MVLIRKRKLAARKVIVVSRGRKRTVTYRPELQKIITKPETQDQNSINETIPIDLPAPTTADVIPSGSTGSFHFSIHSAN